MEYNDLTDDSDPGLPEGKEHEAAPIRLREMREASSAETLAFRHAGITSPPSKGAEWSMTPQLIQQQEREAAAGFKKRELGVTWENLTVEVPAASASVKENQFSQYNIPQLIRDRRQKPPMKCILKDSHGCVKPGEMLLVLGRPGSGCTTLLKMLSNRREGYHTIKGDVRFGNMTEQEAAQYRAQIVMNTEEELFYPRLTVGQTMDFATKLKVPSHLPDGTESEKGYVADTKQFLLESMGIAHTFETKVGNEFVRGVSGGERKRVSIIECLATRGSVFCWDNSTRGLDASTALEWAKALRAMTNVQGLATIVTLYQAGNGIYNLFDKVLVLDEGKQIFYGPSAAAKPFMEDLGFVYTEGANIGDFLTGVTVPTERKIRPSFENKFPRNADAILAEYNQSSIHGSMVSEYNYPNTDVARDRTQSFKESVAFEKNKHLPKNTVLTTSFMAQLKACTIRQYQILWGEKSTFLIKQVLSLAMSLIAGACFYNSPATSAGLFTKGGAVFFSLLYNCIVAMSEVTESFKGRPVLVKQKSFGFYHPAAFCLAQITADFPVLLLQCTIFTVVIYWMAGLKATAAAFFTFWAILFITTLCVTTLFRCIGAAFSTFEAASKISGTAIKGIVMYAGYMIPKPKMKNWFLELYYVNPFAYAFQAALSNEFHDQHIPCVGDNLVPSGPGYENVDSANRACTGVGGALPGADFVTGDQYLLSLHYKHSQLWRNYGVVWGWWGFFAVITIVCTCFWKAGGGGGASLLIPREKLKKSHTSFDEESQNQITERAKDAASENAMEQADDNLVRNTSIFTWKNLTYTVKTPSGDRVLLDNIHGWVKPGMLGALMGSSGAGKTTLLDVLAQRKTDGTIKGSILVDGRPLPVSFQRMAGYCEQLDVHEPFATVREALEFSALLRQPRTVPREEKLRYVETIINLLELHDLADTLIGTVGNGLSVEQRKRVTIGVELVSKPSILIFLDEPTSGLDGQSAYNTVRFLRKLADVGQAVLVTIHQPSAQLFAQFDTLLLLARGGKTVYFGDIGDNAMTIKNYFGQYGAVCPIEANPAEFMIDVVTGGIESVKDTDWHQTWLESSEYGQMMTELDNMISEAASSPPGTIDDGYEFSMPLWEQIKIVTQRMNVALFRNTNYVNNKFSLHVISALLNGFSFWRVGHSVSDLELKMFTTFNFVFVAPGVINQLQPLFIQRRDIYDAREKKSKMYSWVSFVVGLIVSEFPYLCVCAVLYFACWYYTARLNDNSNRSGAVFFIMLIYEFIYTGIGQFVAAYAPNPTFAALVNPLIISILTLFCGIFVPYRQLNVFWKYWLYWMNPFNYVVSGMLTFGIWGSKVSCKEEEFAIFDPANGTCAEYLRDYIAGDGWRINLTNPDATSGCRVCEFKNGSDFLTMLNINHYFYGWRDIGISVIFAISGYALVFGMMKLRTKASKKADHQFHRHVEIEKRDLESGPPTPEGNIQSDVEAGQTIVLSADRVHKLQARWAILRYLNAFESWLDRKLGVETQGVDRIPEEEKRPPSVWNIFLMWWSLNIHVGVLPLGLLGPEFGLSLKQSIAASIIGIILGTLMTATTGTLGPKLGMRQIATSRYSFGFWGAKLCSVLNIVVGGGFAVVNYVVVGQILSAVSGYTMSITVGIVIIAIISYVVSIFGFRLIHTFEKYSWIYTFILICVLIGQAAPHVKTDFPGEDGNSGLVYSGTFLTIVAINFSNASGWCSIAADYYCNFPASTPAWKTFFLTFWGIVIPTTFSVTIGCCLGNAAVTVAYPPYADAYTNHGLGGLISEIYHPQAWSRFCLVLLTFSVLGNNIAINYSSGLSMQLLGHYFHAVPRFIWSLAFAIVVAVLAIAGQQNLSNVVNNFVSLLGYWTVSFTMVLLLEDRVFRRKDGYDLEAWDQPHLLPWGVAAVTALLAGYLAGGVPGMSQTWYVGPIAAKFGGDGGDVGIYMSAVITVLVYTIGRFFEKKYTGR